MLEEISPETLKWIYRNGGRWLRLLQFLFRNWDRSCETPLFLLFAHKYQNGISKEYQIGIVLSRGSQNEFQGGNMRLKELRKARGISQLKLAMDLGMNQNSISRYESGAREADYRTLIALADYFNVSIDYLLERTDDPTFYR